MKTILTKITFLICILLSNAVLGQNENNPHCYKKDAFKNKQLKSNTLTVVRSLNQNGTMFITIF